MLIGLTQLRPYASACRVLACGSMVQADLLVGDFAVLRAAKSPTLENEVPPAAGCFLNESAVGSTRGILIPQTFVPKGGRMSESVDLSLINGTVVTMDPGGNVFLNGAVAIHGRAIVAVGTAAELSERY